MITTAKNTLQHLLRWLILVLAMPLSAQETGLLYDPDPPADSAYVRVILVSPGETLDLLVDKKQRQRGLAFGEAGEYMVLPAGNHQFSFKGKQGEVFKFDLQVPKSATLTLAVGTRTSGTQPLVFEDKANTNKLKALITAYHLAPHLGRLDIVAGTNAQSLFTGLSPGGQVHRQVNPVSVELALKGEAAVGRVAVNMEFGANYSLFILPSATGKGAQLKAGLNRVERYTGGRP